MGYFASDTIYFVRHPGTGRIKVGVTNCLKTRLSTMWRKGEPPFEVMATQAGSRRVEGRVHALLFDDHVGGEWFEPSERVLAFVAAVKWGFVRLVDLPDVVSPLRRASALRGHASRKTRMAEAA